MYYPRANVVQTLIQGQATQHTVMSAEMSRLKSTFWARGQEDRFNTLWPKPCVVEWIPQYSLQTSCGLKSYTLAQNLSCSLSCQPWRFILVEEKAWYSSAKVNIQNMAFQVHENEKHNRTPSRERLTSLLPITISIQVLWTASHKKCI
jgi:hypothetical protein